MARIEASAIKYQIANSNYWHIMSAKRHSDIYELLFKYQIPYNPCSLVEGFITANNKFVNRHEAVYEAIDANQIPRKYDNPILWSEDLWPEEDEE